KVPPKEGADVKKDDVLFEIDPTPYRAAMKQAEANLDLAKKNVDALVIQRDFNKRDYERVQMSGTGASPADLDKAATAYRSLEAQVKQAQSQVDVAQAALDIAKINLGYCTVKAPADGRIGRQLLDVGNMVQ